MENTGSINASEVATLSLLGGGAGGYGYGGRHGGSYSSLYTGNEVLAANAHADGTAVKTAIDGNADLIRAQANSFENATRDRQVAALQMQGANNELRISDRISNIELNSLRVQADTLKAITDAAKDAAACCCDAKLEAAKNTADLNAAILASETRAITRDLDRCERDKSASDSAQAIVAAMQNQTATLATLIGNNDRGHGK